MKRKRNLHPAFRTNLILIRLMALILVANCPGILVKGQSPVTIEEKPLVIPTYQVAPPDKNPIFYTGRNYQGAQGHVYPHPLYDVLTDVRKDQAYKAVYMNNEYLELCILPELGGRIFSALDKTGEYDFFYRQHVIKPALIGMTGAWISGGVEWNIPDHHRATSQLPIDYTMVDNSDGSKTAWVGETELSRGLKWIVGLTVFPGRSYVEATVKVMNPTPFSHSFLYWANVSVHCDDNYQVIFPPNTQYGVQHAKGEFTSWPVGQGRYGGIDRTGVDLSWWKNHPNPASIFAWNFTDDFLAGYDFGKDAGTVHVANHHIVTGKKFFLWGNNPEAEMWEKMLTETDGQYLELMVGAYSDNQPDYSWIAPGETRVFKQYWYPVKKIGGVKNANTEAAVNLVRKSPALILVGLYTTKEQKKSKITVTAKGRILHEELTDIDPASPYLKEISIDPSIKDTELKVTLLTVDGQELISYAPAIAEKEEMPEPIEVPKSPKDYGAIEELYMTGLRIEQFRNALIDPMPYYGEALSRDSLDYRVNTTLGIRYCKEGKYTEAEECLRRAIKRSTNNYTRPKDGEAFYYLGVVLQLQNRFAKAADEFWKATWYTGFQSAAYFRLAQLSCLDNRLDEAISLVDQSLSANSMNLSAINLKAYILRKTGYADMAVSIVKTALNMDKLNHWSASESYFLDALESGQKHWSEANCNLFRKHLGENVQYLLELVNNYGNIGAYEEALQILELYRNSGVKQSDFPMLSYYSGYYHIKSGNQEEAAKHFDRAAVAPPDYCFPWRLEEIDILETASRENPADARALYYLGNLYYYLNQKEKAVSMWEQSVGLDDKFYHALRNLGFATIQLSGDSEKAIAYYEKSVELNGSDPRLFAELDVLRERIGIAPEKRLAMLEKHLPVLEQRDDAITRIVELYNLTGAYNKALAILTKRHFHVWEGGGDIHGIFVNANLLKGRSALEKKQYASALKSFQQALTYPDNLEVGEPTYDAGKTRIFYYIALAHSGLGNISSASDYLNKAVNTIDRRDISEMDFYKAMAFKNLGKQKEADRFFSRIELQATKALESPEANDFFAKFSSGSVTESRIANNYYLLGLASLGKGNTKLAGEWFRKAVEIDPNHLWSRIMREF